MRTAAQYRHNAPPPPRSMPRSRPRDRDHPERQWMSATTSEAAQPTQPAIELRGVSKSFATPNGGRYQALRELSLTVAVGEFCAVVGPTGCGKSTTLTLVAGLERPTEGEALVHGSPVLGIGRDIGFVFQ